MQLESHEHSKKQQLFWDPSKLQIILRNTDKSKTYLLLTNSVKLILNDALHVEQNCDKCNQQVDGIIFSIKTVDISKQDLQVELRGIKYCVLPFINNTCRIDDAIGYKNLFNIRKNTLITSNLILSSQKLMRESQEIDRTLQYTAYSSKESESLEQISNQDLSSSVVFSLQKELQVIEKYEIFVTKIQREVSQNYRNNMFYEYAWSQTQIEYIMHKIEKQFGSIHSLIPRRRYLCFTFAKNKNDCYFKNKYEAIGKEMLFKQQIKIEGSILNYYIVSREQILQNQQQTAKLFLLPNNERIIDMIMINNWIMIAAETYLLAVHSQRPMEYFHHEQNSYPTQLTPHISNIKIVFAIGKKGFIYRYHLEDTKVVLEAKYQVHFVTPHSLVHLESGIAIAGIDIDPPSSKMHSPRNSQRQSRRSIYFIKIDGKHQKAHKHLNFELRLQVVMAQHHEADKPIKNLKSTKQKDVLACSWSNKFYLISVQGFKLIEVELKPCIGKLFTVPFLFNHLNFIVLAENGEIVRIGIESYGESLGAELNPVKNCDAKDCITVESVSSKFELYTCSGRRIDKVSYLNDVKKRFLQEENGKIVKIASSQVGIAYLLDLQHSIELKFLEV